MSHEFPEEHTSRGYKGKRIKFTMILSPEENEMLEEIASALGMTKKEVLLEALQLYAQGRIVDWKQIRGDHIIATLALLRQFVDLEERIERLRVRRAIKEIAEEVAGVHELVEVVKRLAPREEEKESEAKKEESVSNDLLWYLLLGLGQKLGLIETVPLESLASKGEE